MYFLLATELPFGKWIAVVLFIILALSDAVDGFLARSLKQTSALGKLLDPIADKMLVYAAFLGFIEIGKLSSIPILIIFSRDILVMGIRTWAAKKGEIIPAGMWGKWKTLAQMLSIVFLLLNWPFQYFIFWISVILCILSGLDYFKNVNLGEA
jgi:CDP-diacylglycerol--glycerol-3-phosphate 3-phosphatidyltransferase